jgi:type I restriction enzyme S subunit
MSPFNFIEKLLDGVEVEWQPLEQVAKIKHGKDWKGLGVGDIPVYGSGGIMGYVDTYSYNKPTVLIPRKGTITNIFYIESPFWNVDTIYYTEIDNTKAIPKFFYYYMKTINLLALDAGTGRPSLTQAILNKIEIPIPPLNIQAEIVRILDAFTALTAELTAELTARKKQYNYYRDQLLSFEEGEVEWKTLGDIGEVRMCKRILKNQTSETGDIPFYKIGTFGKEPNAYISQEIFNEYKARYSYPRIGEVLISASGTIGRAVIFDGKDAYFQDSNIIWIENNESQALNKYLFYFYKIANWNVAEGGTIQRLYNDNLRKMKIPIPPLAEQTRIVAILDKFDALTHSITEGLPREIKLRQQQYEYYRDLLLSFPKPEDVGAQHE